MYELLIVDDECMITDLLYEYLQQKLEGEIEINKAYSGRAALNIIRDTKIDILLTDINMPGINGIELLKRSKEINPYCKVIFLTGFNDFDHIQFALRNESIDFILKTENNDIIFNSICKAVAELESEMNTEYIRLQAKQQLEFVLPILQERLILSMLDGEEFSQEEFIDLKFPLCPSEDILLMMAHVDDGFNLSKKNIYHLKNAVDEFLARDSKVYSVIETNDILWLLQAEKNNAASTLKLIQANMDSIQKMCQQAFNVSISLVLSKNFIPFSEISYTWHGLKQTMKNLFGLSTGMLLIDNHTQLKRRGSQTEWLYIQSILQNIQLCVECLRPEKYEAHYRELSSIVKKNPQITYADKMEIVMRIYLAFLSNANNNDLNYDIRFVDYFSKENAWELYDEFFKEISDVFFERQSQSNFRNTNVILGNIKNYIHNNLSGDLSLSKLAEIANFNPSYLSRLFKQLTDINIT